MLENIKSQIGLSLEMQDFYPFNIGILFLTSARLGYKVMKGIR
jgi:hypothetical protein